MSKTLEDLFSKPMTMDEITELTGLTIEDMVAARTELRRLTRGGIQDVIQQNIDDMVADMKASINPVNREVTRTTDKSRPTKGEPMPTPQDAIRLHRFGELVAFDFTVTETLYLDAKTAKAFAAKLLEIADDVDNVAFTDSAIGTHYISR